MTLASFSTTRRKPPMPEHKPNHCRWCATFLRGNGREWCNTPEGRKCYGEFEIATKQDSARFEVFRRDRGRCARCRCDASEPEVIGWKKLKDFKDNEFVVAIYNGIRYCGDMTMISPVKRARWHADHIKPLWSAPQVMTLAERNSYWGLGNLQTLCTQCHTIKTQAEAVRRTEMAKRKIRLVA